MLSKALLKRFSLRDSKLESTPELVEQDTINEGPWERSPRLHVVVDTRNPLAIRRATCPDLQTGLGTDLGKLKPRNNKRVSFDGEDPKDDTQYHVNEIFDAEETPPREFFVTAFAKQGKREGDLQDAKDILIVDKDKIITADLVNNRLQIFNSLGEPTGMICSEDIREPWGIARTKDGKIAVTLSRKHCIAIVDDDGNVHEKYGESIFERPAGITIDSRGHFIICDSVSRKVSVFDKDFKFVRELINPRRHPDTFSNPRYVCVNSVDDVIVSDSGDHSVKLFNSLGEFVKSFGGFGSEPKLLKSPYGTCTDVFDNIFVADHYNNRISVFTKNGVFIRHIVTSEHGLMHPQGLVIKENYLYVTHGHLKANEVLVFKLNNAAQYGVHDMEYLTYI